MTGERKRKKKDGTKREAFTTNIQADILHQFRIYCVTHTEYQNDVIERLIVELLEKEGVLIGNTDR